MLMKIPKYFTPDFVKLIMELGHGEELLIADGNFPQKSKNRETVYLPVTSIAELLRDMLEFFPLDYLASCPAAVMEGAKTNGVFEEYIKVINTVNKSAGVEAMERYAFYERTRAVSGIIMTCDGAKFGNIIIKKGVV